MNKREKIVAVRVLRGAAELLREVGWCQNRAVKTDGNGKAIAYCLIGALQAQKASSHLASEAVREYLASKAGGVRPTFFSIPSWNDRKGRKKREVLDALRFTANRLEKEI
jgi:hypothetical protein